MTGRWRRVVVMGGLLGALAAAWVWLWWQGVVELPALAVRGLGRVAGIAARGPAPDVELPVTWHRQEHALSCEVATLKMAIGRYGVEVAESALIAALPLDRTPRQGDVWGNPHAGFVGDIDGEMMRDGYGVYWDPIARLGLQWKRTEVLRGGSAEVVASHVASGRPVIVWGHAGRGRVASWRTPAGAPVHAVDGEHTRLVIGFSGPLAAPQSFTMLDPLDGRLTWTTERFMHNWLALGRNGVVVYPHPRWVRAAGDGRVWEVAPDGASRSWVRNWETFEQQGGFAAAVVEVDDEELTRYTRGPDVSL